MKRKITGMFVCTLLIFAAIFSVTGIVNEELMPLSFYSFGSESITWDAMLNFSEPGGKGDYAVFGEAPDANDGEPPDSYDAPKPPAPMEPYIRAWFDDNLSAPYGKLGEDFRRYPDTEKIWELYVIWKSSDATPININMTWDVSEFIGIEYEDIILNRYNKSTGEWNFAADMLTENYYTYAPEYASEQWLIDHFQINASSQDTTPPETTHTLEGEKEGDLYVGPVTVTLNATDDMSGVNYTMYKINDGVWQEYSSPFVASENGTYVIYFYSVDNAENVEPEKNIIFIIDLSDVVLKVVLMFGQIRNLSIINNFIVFNAVSVRYFSFSPFDFGIYDSGEQIMVSNRFIGLLTFGFILGFFKATNYGR